MSSIYDSLISATIRQEIDEIGSRLPQRVVTTQHQRIRFQLEPAYHKHPQYKGLELWLLNVATPSGWKQATCSVCNCALITRDSETNRFYCANPDCKAFLPSDVEVSHD